MTWQEAYKRLAERFGAIRARTVARWLALCAEAPPRSTVYPFEWDHLAAIARDLARLTEDPGDQELARQIAELRAEAWRRLDGG